MSLNKITSKKNLVILGLNSGTSTDSLDMAVVRFTSSNKGYKIKYLTGREVKYSGDIRENILRICDSTSIDLDELIYFDNVLGRFYGRKASAYIQTLAKEKIKIDAVASHGQTVRHLPAKVVRYKTKVNGTLQLGSPEFIAASCGRVVISDFRQADIALMGEGAPITTPAMSKMFSDVKESRLIVNIGGIANYFYFPSPGASTMASARDCGPGNAIIDLLAQKLFTVKFDKNGSMARRGQASERLLSILMADSFFLNNLKSTGREVFGPDLALKIIDFGKKLKLSKYDLMATATEFTVRSIALKVSSLLKKDDNLQKLYLTGGGRKNIFLQERLSGYLSELDILPIDILGVDGDYVEAVSYAILGYAALKSIPMVINANRKVKADIIPVSGRIVQPPKMR